MQQSRLSTVTLNMQNHLLSVAMENQPMRPLKILKRVGPLLTRKKSLNWLVTSMAGKPRHMMGALLKKKS